MIKIERADVLSQDIMSKADCICFTSNGVIKANGQLVMGAGVALAFARKFPWLPVEAGNAIKEFGNRVNVFWDKVSGTNIVSFPTKHHWRNPSDLNLIAQSAEDLMGLTKDNGWERIYLPFPGVGYGGLKKEDVMSVLESVFDHRITICYI